MPTMRNVPKGLPVIRESEILLGVFPYYTSNRSNDAAGNMQSYQYGSFKNFDDIKLCWNHKINQVVASQKEGNLRVFEWNACLNFEVKRGKTEYNATAFETLRFDTDHRYGLSPGGDLYSDKDKKLAGVVERHGITLVEFSICKNATNRDSIVCYYAEVDMELMRRKLGSSMPKIQDYVSTMTPEQVANFKKGNAYFKRLESRGGYETTAINPYK